MELIPFAFEARCKMKQAGPRQTRRGPPCLRIKRADPSAGHLHGEERKPQGLGASWRCAPKPTTRRLCYFSHASLDCKYASCFMRIRDVAKPSSSQLSCPHTSSSLMPGAVCGAGCVSLPSSSGSWLGDCAEMRKSSCKAEFPSALGTLLAPNFLLQ